MSGTPVSLWLPALDRFGAAHPLRAWLGRADRLPDGAGDRPGLLAEWFGWATGEGAPPLPAAALVREYLKGDAGDDLWLSADPAWVQPEMNGVRLIACGQLQLDGADAQALLDAIAPAFDEAGLTLEPTTTDRWHLRLPPETVLPPFAAPERALGEDLLQHLPEGPQGRRWRVLLNEIQVLLHQHPLQAQRRARGLAPVNSVWLWGGGRLPRQLRTPLAGVVSDDTLLLALATRAGIDARPRGDNPLADAGPGWLVDLHDRPVEAFEAHGWSSLERVLQRQPVDLYFAGGVRWLSRPRYRYRFWRRPVA